MLRGASLPTMPDICLWRLRRSCRRSSFQQRWLLLLLGRGQSLWFFSCFTIFGHVDMTIYGHILSLQWCPKKHDSVWIRTWRIQIWKFKERRVHQSSRRSAGCVSRHRKAFQKKLSAENPSTKETLRFGNSLMKPQCKFETSAKGQSGRTNRLFSSLDWVAAVRAAMATTSPDKAPEKAHFISRPIRLVRIIAKAIELPGDRQKWREIHRCVLMQQRRLLVSRLRRSWHLESVVRNGENELVRCFVSVPYILSPSSSFSPRFRLCSFFYLFSHLTSLISESSYVQCHDGAHKAERSKNAASELRAVRQAIQGMTTKLLLFPKLRTVWFSCVVVLRLVPVLAGKDPVKVGCSGVGGLARFQIFPGYTWIRRMRVQTESCCPKKDFFTYFQKIGGVHTKVSLHSQSHNASFAHKSVARQRVKKWITVIHFYFGADLISVISVQAFFT